VVKETIKQWVREQTTYHMADMSYVRPEMRFCDKDHAFYFNSCAGLIKFTSRDMYEFTMFRNVYCNEFKMLIDSDSSRKAFFALYKRIKNRKWSKHARVKYTANLRTRLRLGIAS